jgi:hypothetical protein
MKKQNLILSTALAVAFSSSVVLAEVEVTGKIVHESAAFTQAGQGIGATETWNQTGDTQAGGELFKNATQVKVFIDGTADRVTEGAAYHVEVNAFYNPKGSKTLSGSNISRYDINEMYTQRDPLREAYLDANVNDWSIRAGKQQVVWGTADGMKLLDTINPTDYSEMAQNQMEDSRIPVWMINAEKDLENGGSFQFIVSQAKGNKIAGLGIVTDKATTHGDGSSDQGHPFVMKGVDTMTGQVNGFLNIGPALGRAGRAFYNFGGTGLGNSVSRVADFADYSNSGTGFETVCDNTRGGDGTTGSGSNTSDAVCLYKIANNVVAEKSTVAGASNLDKYNIIDSNDVNTKFAAANPNSMFEYLDQANFGTFDTFVDMTSEYRVEALDSDDQNIGFKFNDTLSNGLSYSLNYLYQQDPNPYVDFHWEQQDGTKLYEVKDSSTDAVRLCTTTDCGGGTVSLSSSVVGGNAGSYANAVFTEKHARIHNIGGSFDTAIETKEFGPVVLRGEALYQKDVMTPKVVRKSIATNAFGLNKGYFDSAFVNEKNDFLKYVLGADITALTNMMVSAQFIQIINIDHVDMGNKDEGNWWYTGDSAVMSLSNNLQKAKQFKEFYSLFLSKPFGASGEHRWNNILMLEDGGGKWNRLDAEFSINDDVQATVEVNSYFGDENTQFGQLAKSSNIQVGVKYSF